jgi:HAD superfamily hydrolase (TIGR01509 family)
MPGLRAILFDMDGLMVDTEPLYWEVARELAAAHGTTCSDATLRLMMGRSRTESMQIFARECGITGASPETLLAEREPKMVERYARGVTPMAGLREILDRFHGRLRMAVVTSSPRKFADVLLPALGIEQYFDVIQTGDTVARGKPDPEIYLTAIAKLAASIGTLTAAQCLVLEDSRAGALAGKAAGCRVIAVPSHLTASEDFSFADARADDLHTAARLIEALVAPR